MKFPRLDNPNKGKHGGWNAFNWSRHEQFLGKVTDEALAELTGLDRRTVGKKRRALGIPRFRKGEK